MSRGRLAFWGGVGLIVLTGLAYRPALGGQFIWDDDAYFTYNRIRASDGLYHMWCTTNCADYWPVTSSSLWLEWRLWGEHTLGYHLTNLVLHLGEALLLGSILRRLAVPGAGLAVFLFALHPVNVESVAWIAERKNLMAMLFFLLAVFCFIRTSLVGSSEGRAGGRWYWLSLGAFTLGMLSKGSVAMTPFVLLGLIAWHRRLTGRDALRLAPFLAIAAGLVVANIWFTEHGYAEVVRSAGWLERILGAAGVIWFYLYKAVLPFDLMLIYPQWDIRTGRALWWVSLGAAIGVTVLLWHYRRGRARPVFFAWAYFCLMLVPVMGFTDVYFMRYSLVADHYQHLAMLGIIVLAAAGYGTWAKKDTLGRIPLALAAAVVVLFAAITRVQCAMYRDPESLYLTTLARNPECWLAENNLGLLWANEGRLPEAVPHFLRALHLKPDFAEAHSNMGTAFSHTGQLPQAEAKYREALRLNPRLADAHNGLGNVLVDEDRLPEAITELSAALKIEPNFPEAHNGLGNAYSKSARYPEAVREYQQALRLKPGMPEAANNLSVTLDRAGHLPEAIQVLQALVRNHPDYTDAHHNLAILLQKAGRPQEAAAEAAAAERVQQSASRAP